MKVFISSTCNDMTHERDTVERIIKEHGHEAIRSESPSFEARMHAHPHDSCLLALRDCDYVRQYRINATIRIIQQVPSKNCG